jgi:hypothetical protein
VKNARGERTYDFAGAKAAQQYELMTDAGLFFVDRKMSLEGRMNLIFEDLGGDKTRVTANTRYVLTRSQRIQSAGGGLPNDRSDSISFNSGQGAAFPPVRDGQALTCMPTGRLESEVVSLVE